MIPVAKKKKPEDFYKKVTRKAKAFLKKTPKPTKEQIDKKSYWSDVLDDLYEAYEQACAYSGLRFQREAVEVDHFIPRNAIWKSNPMMAYEWCNFRLASRSMNREKWHYQDVVDPFKIDWGWFVIDFPSMVVKSGPGLDTSDKVRVEATIERLKLNDLKKRYIHYRRKLIRQYCESYRKWNKVGPGLDELQRRAPFIAYELKRQKLTKKIAREFRLKPRRAKEE
jgi:hypothetical protein